MTLIDSRDHQIAINPAQGKRLRSKDYVDIDILVMSGRFALLPGLCRKLRGSEEGCRGEGKICKV